ncbi:hypothetical protein P59_164 [Bacillus phage P59]|nr:hypothetical protein P59_164 [Bacillus phage P59]
MKISVSRISMVLEYLQRGGKVYYDGRTYVWLNEKVVRETETEMWVIDGLAIEGRSYSPGEDWEDPAAGKPHYMGQKDMPIQQFFAMIEDIPRDEMVRIIRDLKELRQNNMYD